MMTVSKMKIDVSKMKMDVRYRSGDRPKANSSSSKRRRLHHDETNGYKKMRARNSASDRSKKRISGNRKKRGENSRILKFEKREEDATNKKRMYFSGTKSKIPPKMPTGSTGNSVFEFFGTSIVGSGDAGGKSTIVLDQDGFAVAVLSGDKHRGSLFNKKKTRRIFDELLSSKELGNTRGSTARSHGKEIGQAVGDCRYICLGPKCSRNSRGIVDLSDRLSDEQRNEIFRILNQGEQVLRSTVEADYIKRHEEMLKELEVPPFRGEFKTSSGLGGTEMGETKIFPSIGFGRNVYLPAHIDKDCFLSLVTVCDSMMDNPTCDEVLAYFCFPLHGFAVGLRHGDCVIFNPMEKHCISSKSVARDIYSMSMYCKSALVGGNDNSRPFSC